MKIGDIKNRLHQNQRSVQKLIWVACTDCGKERWVRLLNGKPQSEICHSCAASKRIGKDSPNWKGGLCEDIKKYNKRKRTLPKGYLYLSYPYRSLGQAYINEYGKDLESHFDSTDRKVYKNRIFCMDCPDFETCKGTFWKSCPNKVETIKEMR